MENFDVSDEKGIIKGTHFSIGISYDFFSLNLKLFLQTLPTPLDITIKVTLEIL